MKDQNKTETLDELLSQCDEFIRSNSGPWVFLSCTGCDEIFVKKVTKIFDLEKKKLNESIFLYSKNKKLNHKEKSLQLFFAGVFITSKLKTASACLGQLNVMGERLKKHEHHIKDIVFAENQSEDFINWQPSNGQIQISPAAKIYLEQAGIQIATNSISGSEQATQLLNKNQSNARTLKRIA